MKQSEMISPVVISPESELESKEVINLLEEMHKQIREATRVPDYMLSKLQSVVDHGQKRCGKSAH